MAEAAIGHQLVDFIAGGILNVQDAEAKGAYVHSFATRGAKGVHDKKPLMLYWRVIYWFYI